MKKALVLAFCLGSLAFMPGRGQAAVELLETCTDTLGVDSLGTTVVTWDCALQDTAYSAGDTLTFTVNWTVLSGSASFETFALRKSAYTPKSEPVEGIAPIILDYVDNGTGGWVTVQVVISELHAKKFAAKGTGHYSLYLHVDEDSDGTLDEKASGFGVNLRVVDPVETVPASLRTGATGAPVLPRTWSDVKSLRNR